MPIAVKCPATHMGGEAVQALGVSLGIDVGQGSARNQDLATRKQVWDYPTMTVITDSKKRVVMPGARPGDVFAVEDEGNGHFLLVRLHKPAPPKKKTRAGVLAAIKASKMKFDFSWDQLRELTREP